MKADFTIEIRINEETLDRLADKIVSKMQGSSDVECPNCKKLFARKESAQKYCSDECRITHQNKERQSKKEPLKINLQEPVLASISKPVILIPQGHNLCKNPGCHKTFKPNKINEQFCSVHCEAVYNERNTRPSFNKRS